MELLSCTHYAANGYYFPPTISGQALVSELRCTEVCLESFQKQTLKRLWLRKACVTAKFRGLRDLQYLRCGFAKCGTGKINLTGSNRVELDCFCHGRRFPIVGRNIVHKLTLRQLGLRQPDLADFTSLLELRFIPHNQTSLNLSGCKMLRKLRISNVSGKACFLASINLSHCVWLGDVQCNSFSRLTSLNLSDCTHLKTLTCRGSVLRKLDTSFCAHLSTLDVSHLLHLRLIHTSNSSHQLIIGTEGCGKLQVTPIKTTTQTDSPHNQSGFFTALSIQADSHAAMQAARMAPSLKKGGNVFFGAGGCFGYAGWSVKLRRFVGLCETYHI